MREAYFLALALRASVRFTDHALLFNRYAWNL